MNDSAVSLSPEQALTALQDAAHNFGFDQIGVLDVSQPHQALEAAGQHLEQWLASGYHGCMSYMGRHGHKRFRPAELVPGTTRVIALRLHYLDQHQKSLEVLQQADKAYISRYALGRDYHKTMRQRLKALCQWMEQHLAPFMQPHEPASQYRAFVDSAPVMEKATAQAAGLGWIGKNTLVIDKKAGSWFFLGEIYTNLPIAPQIEHWAQAAPGSQTQHTPTEPIATLEIPSQRIAHQTKVVQKNHCGRCTRCIDVCPTQAIIAPYTLDARRCISYLTIENKGAIPKEMRPAIGNRIFGCDDCQLFCPWNRFAVPTQEDDFVPRHGLDQISLIEALQWSKAEFELKTQGSAIRRAGYYGWVRNLAVAAGNAPINQALLSILSYKHDSLLTLLRSTSHQAINADQTALNEKIQMVLEHLQWAIEQQTSVNNDDLELRE